jgi:hypothetical protein
MFNISFINKGQYVYYMPVLIEKVVQCTSIKLFPQTF